MKKSILMKILGVNHQNQSVILVKIINANHCQFYIYEDKFHAQLS